MFGSLSLSLLLLLLLLSFPFDGVAAVDGIWQWIQHFLRTAVHIPVKNGRHRRCHKMQSWKEHQIQLQRLKVSVCVIIKSQAGGGGRYVFSNHLIDLVVCRSFNTQIPIANIVQPLIIKEHSDLRVIQQPMECEHIILYASMVDDGIIAEGISLSLSYCEFMSVIHCHPLQPTSVQQWQCQSRCHHRYCGSQGIPANDRILCGGSARVSESGQCNAAV